MEVFIVIVPRDTDSGTRAPLVPTWAGINPRGDEGISGGFRFLEDGAGLTRGLSEVGRRF